MLLAPAGKAGAAAAPSQEVGEVAMQGESLAVLVLTEEVERYALCSSRTESTEARTPRLRVSPGSSIARSS